MTNPWMVHLNKVRKTLPNGTSLGKAMKIAKKTYKKISTNGNKKHRRSHKKHRRSHRKRRGGGGEEGEEEV